MFLGVELHSRIRQTTIPQWSVVADGDSLTRGVGAFTPSWLAYPANAANNYRKAYGITTNVALDGETMVSMLANLSTAVYPLITAAHAAGRAAICSCAGGTNDIGIGANTAAQVMTTATSYFAGLKSNGADYTIGWTLLARNNPGTIMTAVLTYNQLLRTAVANRTIQIDYLVDAGADSTIGNSTNVSNATYFPDGLHPSIFGSQVQANLFAAAILSYRTQACVRSVTPTSGTHNGGTTVDIFGSGFAGATNVAIGGLLATIVGSVTDDHIQCTTAAAPGTQWPWLYQQDVAVLGPLGCGQLRGVWTWT